MKLRQIPRTCHKKKCLSSIQLSPTLKFQTRKEIRKNSICRWSFLYSSWKDTWRYILHITLSSYFSIYLDSMWGDLSLKLFSYILLHWIFTVAMFIFDYASKGIEKTWISRPPYSFWCWISIIILHDAFEYIQFGFFGGNFINRLITHRLSRYRNLLIITIFIRNTLKM